MVDELARDFVKTLQSKRDSSQAEAVQRYMKTSHLEFYGIRLPVIRRIAKQYAKRINPEDFSVFLQDLWVIRVFDVRRGAAEILLQFVKRGIPEQEVLRLIDQWLEDIDTWALTDPLGWCVGQVLIKNPDIQKILKVWSTSKNVWRRRMTIIPYVELCLRGQYRPEYGPMILGALRPHIGDSEFFVAKAVGWALRQLSYHEPDMVRRFIKDNKAQMSRLAIREGSRKLNS